MKRNPPSRPARTRKPPRWPGSPRKLPV